MSTFQKVIICGNLGEDPNTKFFDGGGQVTNISVATTEHWRNKQTNEKESRTEWHIVKLNGRLSELAEKYLNKGDKVLIEGKLNTRQWNDDQGNKRFTTEIHAQTMTFMSSKSQSNQNDGKSVTRPENAGDDFLNNQGDDEHDDLPF